MERPVSFETSPFLGGNAHGENSKIARFGRFGNTRCYDREPACGHDGPAMRFGAGERSSAKTPATSDAALVSTVWLPRSLDCRTISRTPKNRRVFETEF